VSGETGRGDAQRGMEERLHTGGERKLAGTAGSGFVLPDLKFNRGQEQQAG